MLHSIGRGPKDDDRTLAGRLLDCHARIRSMTELACRIAETPRPDDQELEEAARRVRRYFRRALPMHVRDEEESILPRLVACAPDARPALERMRREHAEHEALVERVVAACEAIMSDPARSEDVRAALATDAARLAEAFDVHLREEEDDVFPLLASALDDDARHAIVLEMERRREADGGGGGGGGGGEGRRRGGRQRP